MEISIAICEMDTPSAKCREPRLDIQRIHVLDETGIEDLMTCNEIIDIDAAKKAVGDWDGFLKRNRINAETTELHLEKVKKDEDIALLKPLARKVSTGWVDLTALSDKDRDRAMAKIDKENVVTGWDNMTFDEMNEACASCPLSWNKGRGCLGTFGPSTGKLPEIAAKYGCEIVASVPASAESGKVFPPEDAEKLLAETEKLMSVLPDEGKMAVHRYTGPVERLNATAKACIAGKCGFYFFRIGNRSGA